MVTNRRAIFRNKALQFYAKSQVRDILPRFVAPPVFVFLWILLGLLLIATVAAWLGQVPTYVSGTGIVLNHGEEVSQAGDPAMAVIFLPATAGLHLTVGLSVLVQPGPASSQITTTIEAVEPGVLSPAAARQLYALNGNLALIVTQPSLAVMISLGKDSSAQRYAGSIINAQIQIGSRRVLALLPLIGSWIGG